MAARTKEPEAEVPNPEAPAEGPRSSSAKGGSAEGTPDPRKRATRVQAGRLLKAVKDVASIVGGGKETLPILGHLLLHADNGQIVLTGTNMDLWVERGCASDDRDGPGSAEWLKSIRGFAVALPAKPLQALLAELDADAMVTITAPDDLTETYVGTVEIAAGRARFKLHCLPAADFVRVPPFTARALFELPCSGLLDAFARVEHAISSEETRYYLNGIYLHGWQVEGGPPEMRMATTDGHRLVRLSLDPPEGSESFPALIVMRQTIGLLDRLLAEAVKAHDGKGGNDKGTPPHVLIEAGGDTPGCLLRFSLEVGDGEEVTVVAKSIDGTFPDYNRVIPTSPAHCAMIDRAALAEAIKRVSVLTEAKSRLIKAQFTGDLIELAVSMPALGEAREELACTYDGPEMALGLNAAYWREALQAFACDTISMHFDDPGAPVLLRISGDDEGRDRFVQVLMPMSV